MNQTSSLLAGGGVGVTDSLLRQTLVETCARLTAATSIGPVTHVRDRLGDALIADLLDSHGPTHTILSACLLAAHLQPGNGDRLEQTVARVAAADADVARGHRVNDDGTHDDGTYQGRACTWQTGCDACDAHWQQQLDEALDDLLALLGDQALANLTAVSAVGIGRAA